MSQPVPDPPSARRPLQQRRSLVAVPVCAAVVGALLAPSASADEGARGGRAVDVQAHRGGIGLTVESTLASFATALELGVSTLELDVQITQDGRAVVTHDRVVNGAKCRDTAPATSGDPEFPYVGDYVKDLTLAQVRTLDCGSQRLEAFPGQRLVPGARMPLLTEVFDLVHRYGADGSGGSSGVMLNIETKVEAGAPEETAPREQFVDVTTRLVRQAGLSDQVTIQSFDWGSLMAVAEVAPELPLVALTNGDFLQIGQPGASPWLGGLDIDDFAGDVEAKLVAAAASFGADAISPVHGTPQDGAVTDPGYVPFTTPRMVALAHEAGLQVVPWTVDDVPTMASLLDAGVDGIITDHPDRLRALLAERGLPLPRAYVRPEELPTGSGLQQAELVGRAALPARTFGEQVPSGAAIEAANGVQPPFDAQPVQGFSGLLRDGDGWLALSDNGYGNQGNSADYLLRVSRLGIDLATGRVDVVGGFGLSDPDHVLPFALARADRRLTGADLDPESFQRMPDGTFWFGEEFGPSLVHTDADGVVLDAPLSPAGVRSPQAPDLGDAEPTLGGSKGFEGMALDPNGRVLYPLLEGPVTGDDAQTLRMYSFDTRLERYTGLKTRVRLESPGNAIGDLVALDRDRFLVLERDDAQGEAAELKAVYLLDARDRDADGYADKRLLVDLLAVPDPRGLGGEPGGYFSFPFVTIEQLAVVDDHRIFVGNDNNFPFSSGRTPGEPDDDEYALIEVDEDLGVRSLRPGRSR